MPDSRWKLISICTLREEGDPRRKSRSNLWSIFLSTPSARRATAAAECASGVRHISIQALREEGDQTTVSIRMDNDLFLSTPSARRATKAAVGRCGLSLFLSTPSARRATARCWTTPWRTLHFYPRPPRGGRPLSASASLMAFVFLSTPSARRATGCRWALSRASRFLSTPSARRATTSVPLCLSETCISIHALREEGDDLRAAMLVRNLYFYPRPPRGGRLLVCWLISSPWSHFYPRPPRGGRQQKQRQNLYFLINYTTFCTNLEEP